jgi:hypothetical protein
MNIDYASRQAIRSTGILSMIALIGPIIQQTASSLRYKDVFLTFVDLCQFIE